ncbi:MAG TPA: EscU/YscU/HrcU family type III secretion system export apparatus switch protein [Jatrophihabitans sp.]|jgi:flagellar biosynthetic protein FlhB|uniref:EscU/YscU/HrcU family type III secretion system export apparatus switch protein n=1 Tax=Jatrophihabitans sp. TaxID=1932789 RepID=UPI002F06BDEF
MAGKPAGEKTEKATPRKLKKARKDGQVGHTPEVGSWLSVLVASFVIPAVGSSLMDNARRCFVQIVSIINTPDTGRALALTRQALIDAVLGTAPLALLILLTSVASAAVQGGIWVAPKLWAPKFSRLNPLSGFKRMFGPQGVWQLLKSLAKLAVLSAVTYYSVRKLVPALMSAGSLPLGVVVDTTIDAALRLVRMGAAAGLLLAFVDIAVVRKRNNKQLKMTKHEVKEEMKSSEGDPMLRGAQRSRALAISRNRMMADIPTADVIILNPTHLAVALRYDPARGAPRVVAKGGDHVAARIRELAERSRVPMVQDVALARTLYQTCEIGQEIPADLYQGVATVLAFVMRLKRRGSAAGTHRMQPV